VAALGVYVFSPWEGFQLPSDSTNTIRELSRVLVVLAVGSGPYIATLLLARSLIAIQSLKAMLQVAVFQAVVGVALKTVLGLQWGAVGIAIGSTVAVFLTMLLQAGFLDRNTRAVSIHPGAAAI
jgi:peptidoglycan biosynthesis protein MviN/MurJ (putative lipid II flippase)